MAETIHRLVGEALNTLTPARLSHARARAGFAMNRRLPRPGGEPSNAPNPGPWAVGLEEQIITKLRELDRLTSATGTPQP